MKHHILVVDDEEIVLTGLAANLEIEGYRVSTACSAPEALEFLDKSQVDLVLTDLIMEDMDGLGLLRRLAERMPDLPVIVITGHGTAASALEAVRQGAADYIQKPARPQEIAHRIQTVLDAHQLRRRLLEERDHEKEKREVHDAQAARTERMTSIHLFAEGVADDLAAIVAPLQHLPEQLDPALPADHPAQTLAAACRRVGEQAAVLLRDLRGTQVAPIPAREPAHLNDIVDTVVKSTAFSQWQHANPAVQVDVRPKEGLPAIQAVPALLRQTVLTVCGSAFDAIRKGGRLMIATGLEYFQQPVGIYIEVPPGAYGYIRILHSGFVDTADLDRVFEPYYALRRMGRASVGGFGLTRAYNFVRGHGGFVTVRTEAQLGTEITLHFPVPESTPASADTTSVTVLKGSEEILVVDDSPTVRAEAVAMLRTLGYEVSEAADGLAAADLVEKRRNESAPPFDLILLDLILGDAVDGVETYRRIREIRPDQKAVLASGFAETDRIVEGRRMGLRAFVKKPYTLESLGRVIRDVLDRD